MFSSGSGNAPPATGLNGERTLKTGVLFPAAVPAAENHRINVLPVPSVQAVKSHPGVLKMMFPLRLAGFAASPGKKYTTGLPATLTADTSALKAGVLNGVATAGVGGIVTAAPGKGGGPLR